MMPYIRKQFEKRQSMGEFHREALHYFRQYLIVGGMPQAVAEYAATRDFAKVDSIKRQILRLYKNDIKKFAGGATARVSALPSNIAPHSYGTTRPTAWSMASHCME